MWNWLPGIVQKLAMAMGNVVKHVNMGMSASPEVSSSRWNQTIVVVNIVGMLWYMLIRLEHFPASLHGVWRDVAVALIVNVMVSYGAAKYSETKGQ